MAKRRQHPAVDQYNESSDEENQEPTTSLVAANRLNKSKAKKLAPPPKKPSNVKYMGNSGKYLTEEEKKVEIVTENRTNDPFYTRDRQAVRYSAELSRMITDIKDNMGIVDRDDIHQYIEAEKSTRAKIAKDPILSEYLKRKPSSTVNEKIKKTKAFRKNDDMLIKLSKRSENAKSDERSTQLEETQAQGPMDKLRDDGKRIQILSNVTTNAENSISVFDHLDTDIKHVNVPESLCYLYSDKNIPCDLLSDLDEEFEKQNNKIRCDCHDKGSLVKCWENRACPCYQANLELRKMQSKLERRAKGKVVGTFHHETTNFSTFLPIHLNSDSFDYAIGFACSEDCCCKGRCTNNPILLIEKYKDLNHFEIVRENSVTGFQTRTLNYIPAGTPISEFTGEIRDYDSLGDGNVDYAFRIVGDDETIAQELAKIVKADDKLTDMMVEVYEDEWFINPKQVGNVSRTFSHSCEANCGLVRIFQKGFSPNHIRYISVTTEDVFPGEELTYDYGPGYLDKQLEICLCKKPSCKSQPAKRGFTIKKLEVEFDVSHKKRFELYKRTVLDKLNQ